MERRSTDSGSTMRQLEMFVEKRRGKRKGAGRKSRRERPCTRHVKREKMYRSHALHVTLRLIDGLPNLRRPGPYEVIRDAFEVACDRFGMRIVHFTVITNHIHMVIEAESRDAVARGMNGLKVR